MAPRAGQLKLDRGDTGLGTGAWAKSDRRDRRRLALLKHSGLFGADTRGATITRACNVKELRQAYQLVHDEFVNLGYIKPRACGVRIRAFEATAEVATFVGMTGSKVVAVLSLADDSPYLGLPSDISFRPELGSLRSEGMKLCEATNQVVTPSFRKSPVTTELMRCIVAQSLLTGCDAMMATVSPSHSSFYELLGFVKVTDVRSYSSDIDDPVIMMCLYLEGFKRKDPTVSPSQRFVRDFLSFKNPYHEAVKAWESVAREFFSEPEFLRELLVLGSDLLQTCSESEYETIRRCWGDQLFAEVIGARQTKGGRPVSRYAPVSPPRGRAMAAHRISSAAPVGRKARDREER